MSWLSKFIWGMGWNRLRSVQTTIIGVGVLLIVAGTAVKAFSDGDPSTTADWPAVGEAALATWVALKLIFAAEDPKE